ncbi:NYN domain-containing protein [Guggenheimella bovis]
MNELKFALLIDAENISSRYVRIILDEIASFGVVTYRRIYGDWTSLVHSSWKEVLLEYSITPIQQYSYTSGKNNSDSALIIDAMDILYSGDVDGFCIVSSDSDFTRLAIRLRESAKKVIGMGESKTPQAFISACNQFKYLDILYDNENGHKKSITRQSTQKRVVHKTPQPQTKLTIIKKALLAIVDENSAEDGWISSADLGNQLAKRYPDFDVRNFGFKKFTLFVQSLGEFELKRIEPKDDSSSSVVFVRTKE